MPQLVSARLLGAPRIAIAGKPPLPELLWRKHLALCLVLGTAPERRCSREHLIGLLWGETTDRAARHSLNEALRVIRRAAGAGAIDASGDAVAWVTRPQLDTDEFDALEGDDPTAAAALIAGAFCEGFAVPGAQEFERWLTDERTRWQGRLVDALVRAAKLAEDRGDARGALAFAERALRLDGHSDLAVQATIRAHWVAGDRAGALAVAEAYRARMAEDLGLDIDETTAALTDRVARERAPTRPAGRPVAERRSPLIGREEILSVLLSGWRAVTTTPGPALFVINGAAGSGKSRMLGEIGSRAVLTGATVVTMRAVEPDGGDPLAALAGFAVSGLLLAPGIAAAPAAALAAFAARVPAWSERFPGTAGGDAMPFRDAFTAVIRATADEHAVVLAIDDADRLHADELLWFTSFLRAAAGLPVTVWLTVGAGAGSAAVDEVLRRAGRDIPGAAVRLETLTAADLQQLVHATVADWHDDARDRLARRLWAESAGVPGIAVEVLHAVQHGLAIDGATPWPAPDHTLDASLPAPLPEPLVAATRAAFRRLPTDAQGLLAAAALLAEPFAADQAGQVAGLKDADARDAALDTLEWENWIVADGRGYTFPARMKRRLIAREMLTPGQRRRIEDRIRRLDV